MKHNSNPTIVIFSTATLILCSLAASGQAPPMAGFVFANGIDLVGQAQITVDGKNPLKGGLDQGLATSGIPLPVGTHQFQVSFPGLAPAQASLTTAVGACPIFVAYVEELPDPAAKVPKKILKLAQLPSRPQKDRYITSVISFVPSHRLSVKANGQLVVLEFQKPYVAEGRIFRLADDKTQIEEQEYGEKSSQFCLIYEAADKTLKSIIVSDMVYTW